MSRFTLPVLAALLLGISAPPVARADGPSVYTLAETARFDPHSPTLGEIVRRLDQEGERGWKALASLALDLEGSESTLPALAAGILTAGDEVERLAQAGRLYDNSDDEALRTSLALGLARAYPAGARRLHAHLRANLPGALDLLRELLPRGLPHDEVEAALEHPELASLARDHIEGRTPAASAAADLPRARDLALDGLDAVLCRAFVAAQLASPDPALLTGLAEVLREQDERRRVGAHCLLLSVSGLDMAPDPGLWHAWIETHGSAPPSDAASRGAIAAAVTRGTLALRKYLQTRGPAYWPWAGRSVYDSASGGTALAVLALLASGVPADDEAIQGAIQRTLFVYDRGERAGLKPYSTRYETYTLSLLAMAIRRLDPVVYSAPLVAIRDRLAAGILESGMWTYTCPLGTTGTRPERGDNSNTQYANLGLRALRGCGVSVERSLWERVDAHWRESQFADGGWGYTLQGKDVRRGMLQMTASGVAGLAIAAEGLHESDAAGHLRVDDSVRRGLAYLGRCLFLAKRKTLENYAWYAVERACMLTGTRLFAAGDHTYDWYREGARHLLATQNADGSWGRKRPNKWLVEGYGLPVDTAFALLFLTRSTATVGDGANEGVVQVKLTAREREALAAARSTPPPRDEPAPTQPAEPAEPVAERAPDLEPTPAPADLDQDPPRITFVGSAIRHVGKQRILVEADEVLDGVKVGRHYFPADGRRLWITAELTERHRSLTVFAYDLAGNRTRASLDVEVQNRVLVLDGKSVVRVTLRSKPRVFTAECWVRAEEPTRNVAVLADTEAAGFGIFLRLEQAAPQAILHTGAGYQRVVSKRRWRWGRWTHVALTYDGTTLRYFENGKEQGNVEAVPYRPSRSALFIGGEAARRSRWESGLVGAIDEVRISDVVRYTADFKPAFSHLADPHTLLLYHFDTDTETAILDASASHRNGTPLGAPKIEAEAR